MAEHEPCPGATDEPTLVYDGAGNWLGLVVESDNTEYEAYALPGLALIGVFRTRRGGGRRCKGRALRDGQLMHAPLKRSRGKSAKG